MQLSSMVLMDHVRIQSVGKIAEKSMTPLFLVSIMFEHFIGFYQITMTSCCKKAWTITVEASN